jgi:bifunctional non-homologous end joining protein LigD
MPVTWNEVKTAFRKKDSKALVFEAAQVVKRVQKKGDLFASVLKLKQKLPDAGVLE